MTRVKEIVGGATAEASLQSVSPSVLGESSRQGSTRPAGQARLESAAWRGIQAPVGAERGSGDGRRISRVNDRHGAGDADCDVDWDGVGGALGLEMSIVGDRSSGMQNRTPGRERRAQKR